MNKTLPFLASSTYQVTATLGVPTAGCCISLPDMSASVTPTSQRVQQQHMISSRCTTTNNMHDTNNYCCRQTHGCLSRPSTSLPTSSNHVRGTPDFVECAISDFVHMLQQRALLQPIQETLEPDFDLGMPISDVHCATRDEAYNFATSVP